MKNCYYCKNKLSLTWRLNDFVEYYSCNECPIIIRHRFVNGELNHIQFNCDNEPHYSDYDMEISVYYELKITYIKNFIPHNLIDPNTITPATFLSKVSIYKTFK